MSKEPSQLKPAQVAAKPKSVKKRPKREMMQYGNAIKTEQAIYTIVDHLGSGGFGDVYKVYRNQNMEEFFALKTEEYNVPGRLNRLKMEAEVLQKCTEETKPHFIKLIDKGRTADLKFIIMTMVGPTLDKVRAGLANKQFSQSTATKICVQLLEAVRDLHAMRYLHRDLKPSNFAVGLRAEQRGIVFMLDFGVARPYMSKEGQLLLPRAKVSFMGTLRFAPVAAHQLKDQSRRDELESLLYVMADVYNEKNLMWRGNKNIPMLVSLKQSFVNQTTENAQKALSALPDCYKEVLKYVRTLAHDVQPAYDVLIREMDNAVRDNTEPMDWMTGNWETEEEPRKTAMATVMKTPSVEKMGGPTQMDGVTLKEATTIGAPSGKTQKPSQSVISDSNLKDSKKKETIKKEANKEESNRKENKKEPKPPVDDRQAPLDAVRAGHEEARKKVTADKRPQGKSISRMDRLIAEHEKRTKQSKDKPSKE